MAGKYERMFDVKGDLISRINKKARAITFLIDQYVVLATPVDIGEARGSWQVSVNKPITADSDTIDKNGSISIEKARGIINGAATITYPTFYIRSNKPYMQRLNSGWSQQAPNPFVEASILRGINASKSIPF